MSDTYNPNEIAKVKHLDELARQLAIKLDGGTDPKPTIKKNGSWRIVTANSDLYYYDESGLWEATIPVAKFGVSKGLQFRLTCNSYETATQIVDLQSTNNTDWKLESISWVGDGSTQEWRKNMWYVTLNTPVNVTTCDISFRIKVAETASYAGIDLPVIVHIVEE